MSPVYKICASLNCPPFHPRPCPGVPYRESLSSFIRMSGLLLPSLSEVPDQKIGVS